MSIADFSGRSRLDACPGALQVHAAADGGLARVRVPGGRLTPFQLRELAEAASAYGGGVIELTSRANVQVRGLGPESPESPGSDPDNGTDSGAGGGFAARMAGAGLLPSATHERIRNILASPLTGLPCLPGPPGAGPAGSADVDGAGCPAGGGIVDVTPLVGELDRRLCARPALAALPGRFMFALDDGRGDVAGLGADAGILPTGPDEAALILAGTDTGLRVPLDGAVTALLAAAEAFLDELATRDVTAWRPRKRPLSPTGGTGPGEGPGESSDDGWDDGWDAGDLPGRLTAHIGSAAVVCSVRPLGGRIARLRLAGRLPLHAGDVLLLRDPGRVRGEVRVLARASVLDPRPPGLRRRGAARERAAELAAAPPDAASLLRTHLLLRTADLAAMGCVPGRPVCGDWHADPAHWSRLGERLPEVVRRHASAHPLEPGMPVEAARHELALPERRLVAALVRPPLALDAGRIVSGPTGRAALPAPVVRAVERLGAELSARPFRAPEAGRLAELGLGSRELAAAVRAGALLRVADGIVLLPGADVLAGRLLARLPQPFTVSQARQALGTSRRVAVPLLEHLDRRGLTERIDEVHRRCPAGAGRGSSPPR
ncbi:SelB C-terminal domain-containing protein [Streptosporangium sp. NPDC048865]|uniref:SelB domain-containing protein n=1 Tax=Streptosporangium sp. NPDC048865 TaxID=3155766 RepID=UPI00342556C1